jgi:hypothetical protein
VNSQTEVEVKKEEKKELSPYASDGHELNI